MEIIKIGYFADGKWAHKAFEKIVNDSNMSIVFICVRCDYKDPILMELGKKNHIDVIYSENVNSVEFIEKIKKYDADIFVSMSFNQIFKEEIINLPKLKTINCHAGKLPYYRGRNILNWALINDEKEFGITVHYVDEGIDTGDIILQRCFGITDDDTYQTLLTIAHKECAEILYDALKQISNGNAKRICQKDIDEIGMYCGMRQEGDEIIDWNQSSRNVFNFVRAICSPGPMAQCYCEGYLVKINKVNMIKNACSYIGIPGQIVGKSKKGYYVKTKDSIVEIVEFVSEKKLRIGSRLKREKE